MFDHVLPIPDGTIDDGDRRHLLGLYSFEPSTAQIATAAQTVPTPSQSASGAEEFAATAAQTVPTPSQSATGGHESIATAVQTVPTPSQSATGVETFVAAAAQTIPTPSQSATGEHSQGHTAAAAQTVPTPTQAATGTEEIPGTAAQIASTPSQSATGVMHPDATVAQTVPVPTQSATGTHATSNMSATAAQIAPTPAQVATGAEEFIATAGQTAPTPSQVAAGVEILTATAAQTVPTPLQAAVASEILVGAAGQTVPTPSQAATGVEAYVGIAAQLPPTPTQAATGAISPVGVAAQIVPTPSQSATGERAISGTAPITGASRALLPDFSMDSEIYAGAMVYVYGLTLLGAKDTGNLVPLYTAKYGDHQIANPVPLNGNGVFPAQVYVDQSVIIEVAGQHVLGHESGVVEARAFGQAIGTAADGDLTPSVAGLAYLILANTVAASVTDFDDPQDLQRLVVQHTNDKTTLMQGSLKMYRSRDFTGAADDMQEFIYDDADWREIKRIESRPPSDPGIFSTDFSEGFR